MSYDVSLVDAWGSHDVGNMTSNVCPMWHLALGFPLREMHNQRASACIPHLERAITLMGRECLRPAFKALAPDNGWGSVAGAQEFLGDLLEACHSRGNAIVEVSR